MNCSYIVLKEPVWSVGLLGGGGGWSGRTNAVYLHMPAPWFCLAHAPISFFNRMFGMSFRFGKSRTRFVIGLVLFFWNQA